MSMEETDALDRLKAAHAVVGDLKVAEARAEGDGWLTDDDLQKEMGLDE